VTQHANNGRQKVEDRRQKVTGRYLADWKRMLKLKPYEHEGGASIYVSPTLLSPVSHCKIAHSLTYQVGKPPDVLQEG